MLNKRAIESLIKAGGFDSLGHPRKGLLTVFEPIVDATLRRRRERDQGTMSLFDLGGGDADDSPVFDDRLPIPDVEFDKSERLRAEKEMLGLYVSDHPLMGAESRAAPLRRVLDRRPRRARRRLDAHRRRRRHRPPAQVHQARRPHGARSCSRTSRAAIEVMVFPKTMLQYGELLDADAIVVIKARVDGRDDTPKLMAMEITRPEINLDGAQPLTLRVKAGVLTDERVARLRELLRIAPRRQPGVRARRRPREGDRAPPRRRVPLRRAQRPLRRAPRPLRRRLHRVTSSNRRDSRRRRRPQSRRFGVGRYYDPPMRIGILGATGPAGSGLAARLASVGHEVLYGSRAVDKAEAERRRAQRRSGATGSRTCIRATTRGRATRRS